MLTMIEIDVSKLRDVPVEITPKYASAITKEWLEFCQEHHPLCRPAHSAFLPTRLVFVGEMPSMSKICASSDIPAGTSIKYTTLSHCWGEPKFLTLTSLNLDSMMECLPTELLTPVFRDAIDLTRSLGIEYIWIDSLCIVQDSHKDWTYQSEMMGEVYKHSWLNIAATSQVCSFHVYNFLSSAISGACSHLDSIPPSSFT